MHNAPDSQKAAACFKTALFANSNAGDETYAQPFSTFFFILHIIYASSQDTQMSHDLAHHALQYNDISLTGISIPNVMPSACTRTYTGGVGGKSNIYVGRKFTRVVEA